ncbi:hypothetical protein DOTSEDRAFT_43604, partial [Dothistroma septosporum NZE10]
MKEREELASAMSKTNTPTRVVLDSSPGEERSLSYLYRNPRIDASIAGARKKTCCSM